jgi:hypothetical protein
MWISWSYGHVTHNKIDYESRKTKTGLIGVWPDENLCQEIYTNGIRTLK